MIKNLVKLKTMVDSTYKMPQTPEEQSKLHTGSENWNSANGKDAKRRG